MQCTSDAAEQRLVYTAPKLTTPASRRRKTAMALHSSLLARYDRLRLATPAAPGLRILLWTKSIGDYCFVYQLGERRSVSLKHSTSLISLTSSVCDTPPLRHGLTFKLLPGTATRRYLVADASTMSSSQPFGTYSVLDPAGQPALSPTALQPPLASALTPVDPSSRLRFWPIPNLSAAFRQTLATVCVRQPVARALVEQRKRDRRTAPIVVLDARRAVCELPFGPEMLEELDQVVLDALLAPLAPLAGQQTGSSSSQSPVATPVEGPSVAA